MSECIKSEAFALDAENLKELALAAQAVQMKKEKTETPTQLISLDPEYVQEFVDELRDLVLAEAKEGKFEVKYSLREFDNSLSLLHQVSAAFKAQHGSNMMVIKDTGLRREITIDWSGENHV